jgi:hypothetical protein
MMLLCDHNRRQYVWFPGGGPPGLESGRTQFIRNDSAMEHLEPVRVGQTVFIREVYMGFGKGALLWLIGIPLPIIIILALFMHH